ncbi:unnamed protein product, partial [Phaeothamnion confervicola]
FSLLPFRRTKQPLVQRSPMNLKEHILEELELHEFQLREALQCLLHTILFIRAPGPVEPREAHCEHFDLTFARCGVRDIDKTVDDAIEQLLHDSLMDAGPDLAKGCITLSFFERRRGTAWLGLVPTEEKVVWEQWVIPVLVNKVPAPIAQDQASGECMFAFRAKAELLAQQRLQETAEVLLHTRMRDIFGIANGPIDHVPPVMYEFEV